MIQTVEIVDLVAGVSLIEADLPDFSVRAAMVSGARGTILWDTLASPGQMKGLKGRLTHGSVTVIYSHGDWDHVWGTSGLSVPVAEVVAHSACARRFSEELPTTLQVMRGTAPSLFGDVRLVPPSRTLSRRETFELGGLSVQVEPMPGHTPDSLVAFIPESGVFLAGDAAEAPLPFLNPESPVRAWIEGLEGWAARLEDVSADCHVVPSHGPIGGPDLLRANARYLADILSGNEPSIDGPLTPFYRETHENNRAILLNR